MNYAFAINSSEMSEKRRPWCNSDICWQ